LDLHPVSIATSFDHGVPLDVQVALIAEAVPYFVLGVDEAHSGYLIAAGQARIRALAERYGLGIDTIHGPRTDRPDSLAPVSRAVAAAAELGVPVVVIHGSPFDFPAAELDERLQQIVRRCEALTPCTMQ
jgi:sugar phosphate isomerase/epimerase